MHCFRLCTVVVAALVAAHGARAEGDFLATLQGLLGGLGGGGGNSELTGLLTSFFNQQGDAGGASGLSGLWNTFASQFGLDPTDIAGITNKLRATKEFRENLDNSYTACAAITKDHKKNLARSSCPNAATVHALVFDELLGGEQTLDYVLEAGEYAGFEEAVYFCHAREVTPYNTWAALGAFANTAEGRRQRSRTSCVVQMNKEKRMCGELKSALCALANGEHLECRRDSEMRKFNHRAVYFPMASYKPSKPLTSLRQVANADFADSIPHPSACDQLALMLESQALRESVDN